MRVLTTAKSRAKIWRQLNVFKAQAAKAAVRLKVVVLLLVFYCFMLLPLNCGGSVLGPCFVMYFLVDFQVLQSSRKRERVALL